MVGRICLVFLLVGCGNDDGGGGGDTVMGATSMPEPTTSTTDGPTSAETLQESSGSKGGSGSSGGDSSSTGVELPEVDFETDIQPLLNANCTCHLQGMSGTMTAPYLTLNPGVSHGQLVGMPAMQLATYDRVAPGDLDGSYMWHKVNNTHLGIGGEGTMMPQTVALDDDNITLIRAWIVQGANP